MSQPKLRRPIFDLAPDLPIKLHTGTGWDYDDDDGDYPLRHHPVRKVNWTYASGTFPGPWTRIADDLDYDDEP